ncbi:MAG: hypothetical protein CALGDGBN_01322 [Pseudomonadales bacterium]|nr:hypothetical protein [Pseudomonadales bacterium]
MAQTYFVTGGTGFIGRFLVPKLLDRGGRVYLLVREQSLPKVEQLRVLWGVDDTQLVAVTGDIARARLGVERAALAALKGRVDHVVHLAAIYDITADEAAQQAANVGGTRHALAFAKAIGAGCFHHVSSIAVAGLYRGRFTEDMFDEATGLENPYYRSKHEAEALVRRETAIAWRIYRPGVVVGHSATGEIDKIDGPYFFFPAIRRVADTLPRWLRAVVLQGGVINIVPVDFVVAAMDHLMHQRRLDGRTFFLTDPQGISVGDLVRVLLEASRGPRLGVVRSRALEQLLAGLPVERLGAMVPSGTLEAVARRYGIPPEALKFIGYPTRFDSTRTHRVLERAGIACPSFESYAPVIWDYWERHLAGERMREANAHAGAWSRLVERTLGRGEPRGLRRAVAGKVVVVTGASSGIGRDCALQLAAAGATVILAARGVDKLGETIAAVRARGGAAFSYPCDIADMADCDRFVAEVLRNHGHVDILINNAGRSIRRSVRHSFDRFHDYERTMQLNYFGALRLIMGFAPGMLERRGGHIVNISSIGVLASPPRFSAYVASKAALDAFSWCAASEFADRDVRFTTINMPLVRTPMIAPTRLYDAFPTLTPEQAANLVMKAIVERPKRVATGLGVAGAVAQALAPQLSEFILNRAYHLFPDSPAARGVTEEGEAASPRGSLARAQRLFAQVFSGVHW